MKRGHSGEGRRGETYEERCEERGRGEGEKARCEQERGQEIA